MSDRVAIAARLAVERGLSKLASSPVRALAATPPPLTSAQGSSPRAPRLVPRRSSRRAAQQGVIDVSHRLRRTRRSCLLARISSAARSRLVDVEPALSGNDMSVPRNHGCREEEHRSPGSTCGNGVEAAISRRHLQPRSRVRGTTLLVARRGGEAAAIVQIGEDAPFGPPPSTCGGGRSPSAPVAAVAPTRSMIRSST